jgi:transketolase
MGDGEDGPTHQPVEHLASLRAIPGLVTFRPGDANEVVEAYRYIMQPHKPAVLACRATVADPGSEQLRLGGWGRQRRLRPRRHSRQNPEVILIASGSEVSLAVEAHEKLIAEGTRSRVVSMPAWDVFEHQTKEDRDGVLPPNVKARVAIEQASTFGWERYVGEVGRVIGMKTFGASAPLKELQKKFGFEPDRVVTTAKEILAVTRI